MSVWLKDAEGFPTVCDAVFATIVAGVDGRGAALYWARCQHFGTPLTLLDWELSQLLPSMWDRLEDRIEELKQRCRARYPQMPSIVEGVVLAQQAESRGVRTEVVPDALTSKEAWESLGLAATFHVREGSVKVTKLTQDKATQTPLGALNYRGGERTDDPTIPAFLYGIVMSLEETDAWVRPPVADRMIK